VLRSRESDVKWNVRRLLILALGFAALTATAAPVVYYSQAQYDVVYNDNTRDPRSRSDFDSQVHNAGVLHAGTDGHVDAQASANAENGKVSIYGSAFGAVDSSSLVLKDIDVGSRAFFLDQSVRFVSRSGRSGTVNVAFNLRLDHDQTTQLIGFGESVLHWSVSLLRSGGDYLLADYSEYITRSVPGTVIVENSDVDFFIPSFGAEIGPGMFRFIVPVTLNTPTSFGLIVQGSAEIRSLGTPDGIQLNDSAALVAYDISRTVYFGGFDTMYLPNGEQESDFAVLSDSGIDWRQSFIPVANQVSEPTTSWLLFAGLGAAALMRRAPRRT
jgi:hypothetical protein